MLVSLISPDTILQAMTLDEAFCTAGDSLINSLLPRHGDLSLGDHTCIGMMHVSKGFEKSYI